LGTLPFYSHRFAGYRLRAACIALLYVCIASRAHAQVINPYESCGTLISTPNCVVFQPDNSSSYLVLVNYGGFQVGDRVHVIGHAQQCSSACQTGYCLFGNSIEGCAPLHSTSYCFGDGTSAPCPCSNGSVGFGCPNSADAGGGGLTVTGGSSLSQDTIVLMGWNMPNTMALYFQGSDRSDIVFGDGKRCAGGSLVYLAVKESLNGRSKYPEVGEPRLATRGMVTVPGKLRYQLLYRDPSAFCTSAAFNFTNAVEIDWQP
jgi:hypothetical protein